MTYQRRIIKLALFFVAAMVALSGYAGYRMLSKSGSMRSRIYIDKSRLDLIHDLARTGVIINSGTGVVIDPGKLKKRISSQGIRDYITARKRYMSFEDGVFKLDNAAIKVTNRRVIVEAVNLARGRILDRHGQVLARTVVSDKGRRFREYPLGPATLPLLGVAHPIYGQKGLERHLAPYLEGRVAEGFFSRTYRFFSGKEKVYDVKLTLDAEIQALAFEKLKGKTGAVVALDAATGEILAAASNPSFDPATTDGAAWDRAAGEGFRGPFTNRALQRRYPPGSTFKTVTAAAWIDQSDFDIKWGLDCKGRHTQYKIREYRGKRHKWVSLKTAFPLSCNVFFADIGPRLGPQLLEYANLFGFNRRWPVAEETPGSEIIVPSRAFHGRPDKPSERDWRPEDFRRNPKLIAQAAIGQNIIQATPLQMAMVGAVVANGGTLMAPRLVGQIQYVSDDPESSGGWFNYESSEAREIQRVCRRETAETVLSLMAAVTDKGTGHNLAKIIRVDGQYRAASRLPKDSKNLLAGKTGTAETGVPGARDHSWFLAVAPVDQPRFAVAVIVENGGLGSRNAGPIAAAVILKALQRQE